MEPKEALSHISSQVDQESSVGGLRRTMTAVIMVVTVGAAAYLLSTPSEIGDSTNLVGLVGSVDIDPQLLLESTRRSEIEDFAHDQVGFRFAVPEVVGAKITGFGTWDAGRNLDIPVILYDDPQGDIRLALVMNYAMLDDISGRVFLDRSIRLELEQDHSYAVVSASDNREVVLWRAADDIFVAIAEQGASRLIPRIDQPDSGA